MFERHSALLPGAEHCTGFRILLCSETQISMMSRIRVDLTFGGAACGSRCTKHLKEPRSTPVLALVTKILIGTRFLPEDTGVNPVDLCSNRLLANLGRQSAIA